jgi:hypothetical protein
MSLIAEFFSTTVTIINRLHSNGVRELGYLVRTAKFNSNYIMVSYLLQYPLLSYKYRSPEVLASVLALSMSKGHKDPNGNVLLSNLKSLMKSDPKYTQRQHIDQNFYKY